MRLLIIDDEAVFQQKIKERLTAFFAAENVAAEIDVCGDPAAVKEKGLYRSCDVLLLDIEMPALSGLDLAAAINKQRGGSEKPYIIFVTNRDELVFDALNYSRFPSYARDISRTRSRACGGSSNGCGGRISSSSTRDAARSGCA